MQLSLYQNGKRKVLREGIDYRIINNEILLSRRLVPFVDKNNFLSFRFAHNVKII